MDVRELTAREDRREAVPVLRQLWSDSSPGEVLAWTGEDDYHLFGGHVDGELVGVAGVVETNVLHHVDHAWLYDLVVDESHRGEGYGTELVGFVEDWAAGRDCDAVALASPLAKEGVHEFYRDRGYETWGYVVEKSL